MRRLVWSPMAREDIRDAIHYISQDNPFAAKRVADRLREAASALQSRPTGRPGRVAGTYEKVVPQTSYILAYAFQTEPEGNEVIYLLRIIHTARNWRAGIWPK